MAQPSSPDSSARSLYVGNVDPQVTEAQLMEAFDSEDTKVIKVKLFKNKSLGATSEYGFVDFEDHDAAERALQRFNGLKLAEKELKVNWANSSPSHHSSSHGHHPHNNHHHHHHTSPHNRDPNHPSAKVGANGLFNIFVGDLDPQVDDATLKAAFVGLETLEDAKVMLDTETGASRGFGFVMFKERQDAQKAISDMYGKPLLSRNMRLNWAHPQTGSGGSGGANRKPPPPAVALDYNEVVNQSPPSNVTVYVGNLAADVTTATLQEMFSPYGEIAEVRDHADPNRNAVNGVDPNTHRGYGFVLFKTHESAARAIVGLNGKTLNGKQIKCSWGNEKRPVQNTTGNFLAGFPYGSPPFTNGYGNMPNLYFYHPQYSPFPMQPGLPAAGGANLANLPAGQAPPQFNAMWAAWNAQAAQQWPPGSLPGALPSGSLPPGSLPAGQSNHAMPMSFASLAGASQASSSHIHNGALSINGGIPMGLSNGVPSHQVSSQTNTAPQIGETQSQFGTH